MRRVRSLDPAIQPASLVPQPWAIGIPYISSNAFQSAAISAAELEVM